MTGANEVGAAAASRRGRNAPIDPAPADPAVMDMHREINARRARVENPELLRRLRGL